jgi:hypothetical protein
VVDDFKLEAAYVGEVIPLATKLEPEGEKPDVVL